MVNFDLVEWVLFDSEKELVYEREVDKLDNGSFLNKSDIDTALILMKGS